MKKRIISLLLTIVIVFSMLSSLALVSNATMQSVEEHDKVIKAINSLLVGVNDFSVSEVDKWTDETIQRFIYQKLLWEEYAQSGSIFKSKTGIEYQAKEDGFWYFDLELIQEITRNSLGRDFPVGKQSNTAYVSGNKFVVNPATGESTTLSVQNFRMHGKKIMAVGSVVHNYNASSEFEHYFQAIVEENPTSTYGYTLISLKTIEGNQNFDKLTASASSELLENTNMHVAKNVIDGDLKSAWVEAVDGVGINEWIKIENEDGSPLNLSAIELATGYQRSEELLKMNGHPNKVLIEYDTGYKQTAELYEYNNVVVLDQSSPTKWIKITILGATEGTKFADTCISEITLFGLDTTAYFDKIFNANVAGDISEDNEMTEDNDYKKAAFDIENIAKIIVIILVVYVIVVAIVIANKKKKSQKG